MSNETDLDWLARNVHECPSSSPDRTFDNASLSGWEFSCGEFRNGKSVVTKDQWLYRRAELQSKPNWEDAPEWALSVTQRINGEWFWLGSTDQFKGPSVSSGCVGEILGDWRDTLERRPDMYKSEPKIDTSAEHVQKTAESMRDWFERGELPPVGVVCEAYIDYPPQWVEAEIVAHKDGFAIGWCKSVMKGCHGDKASEFRPIRTERDVLIEIIKKTDDTDDKIADAILAAGFKRGAA